MNEIKTFSDDMFSILIKQDNENNLFDLETVAKSLGFTQFKNGKQYIRWETINKYLGKYLSQEVGKGDFIPEPMVYKLAFKAGNAVAEKISRLVGDGSPTSYSQTRYLRNRQCN